MFCRLKLTHLAPTFLLFVLLFQSVFVDGRYRGGCKVVLATRGVNALPARIAVGFTGKFSKRIPVCRWRDEAAVTRF